MSRTRQHFKMPDKIREHYKTTAYTVYSNIAGDVPGMEQGRKPHTPRVVVEIIRDANRIKMQAEQDLDQEREWVKSHAKYQSAVNELAEFVEWLKLNEYGAAYQKDMDVAVREAVGL